MDYVGPNRPLSFREVLELQFAEDPQLRAEWQRLEFARQVAVELIRYRSDRGLSQRQLAEVLGISQPRVAKLELAEHNPRIETVIDITRKTGIEFVFNSAPADAAPTLLAKAVREKEGEECDGVVVRVAGAVPKRRRVAA